MREQIAAIVDGQELSAAAMDAAMDAILRGDASAAQTAAFATALRMRGETVDELAVAARVMRRHAVPVRLSRPHDVVLDTCGTGGDGSGTFNISTVASLVVAACSVTVAKHGNRAATSACGSADLLEALGIDLEAPPERIARCIDEVGIGFMFARKHHPAMRHAAPVRAEIGIRTVFNLLGPLSNPADATHQLLGVGDPGKVRAMAEVLLKLGTKAAWVVHGEGGLDEVSLCGATRVVALGDGALREFVVEPADFGVSAAGLEALRGGDAACNARIAHGVFEGQPGPYRDAVLINAAAALCVAGVAATPREGAERAAEALDSGATSALLRRWVAFGQAD